MNDGTPLGAAAQVLGAAALNVTTEGCLTAEAIGWARRGGAANAIGSPHTPVTKAAIPESFRNFRIIL